MQKGDNGVRTKFESARQYLLERFHHEPTTQEIMDYQDFMMSN